MNLTELMSLVELKVKLVSHEQNFVLQARTC